MVFIALAVILPTLVTGAVTVFTFRRALVSLSLREQSEASRRLAERVAASVDGVRKVLSTMASQDFQLPAPPPPAPEPAPRPGKKGGRKPRPVRRPAAPQRNHQAEEALKRFLKNYPAVMEAALIGPDGMEKVKSLRRGNRILLTKETVNRSDRDEVKRALAGRAATGPVFFTAREHYPQLFLCVPLAPGKGALLARISLDGLSDLLTEAPGASAGGAYVVDNKGVLIAHPDRRRVLAREKRESEPVVREFVTEGGRFVDGGRVIGNFEGKQTLVAATKVPSLGWLVVVQKPLGDSLIPLVEAGRRAGKGAGAVGLVFLIAGLWLAHRILKPLRLLQEGVHKIGQGELSHRLTIRTGDEIQMAADEFNAMADSLERLEATKRDLTHMIVHDLKSPLSSVLGSIDYVLMAAKEVSPEHRKLLMLGSKAGKDQLRMIQNLLDLGKMEEGKLELHPETFSLLDLAGQCVDDLEANINREGKMVSVEVPKDLPKAYADRDLIHRVLSNLVANALKHTSKGAEIAIRAEAGADGRSVVLSVRDTGEGIPAEYLEKIFEKFGQAELRRQSFRVGSGLGLTFCKLAVESHGGKIWVKSDVGKGSEFFVELPGPPVDASVKAPAFPSTKITK